MIEQVDRRVLGAIRVLDAVTGLRVIAPLRIEAPGLRLTRNLMGDYVILDAPGLRAHTFEFLAPPPTPAAGSVPVELTIRDAGGEYLPQRRTILLPRDPDAKPPGDANRDREDSPNSIFRAIEIALYPAPNARTAASWALVRATVIRQGTSEALGGALIRVVEKTNGGEEKLLGRGLSDERGEALVAIPGIKVTNWSQAPDDGPVMTPKRAVTLQVIFDPAAQGLPNPESLEENRAALPAGSVEVQLQSGQTLVTLLPVPLP